MIEPNNPILSKMLDRLFAAMLNGPSMNCRPHNSRQRLDLVQLGKLRDLAPGDVLMQMLSKEASVKLAARVSIPARKNAADEPETPEQTEAQNAWADQQFVRLPRNWSTARIRQLAVSGCRVGLVLGRRRHNPIEIEEIGRFVEGYWRWEDDGDRATG